MEETNTTTQINVLGKTFSSEEERRNYFREELRKKLPELKQMEGFPIGEDEDIINLSDPPYYTACPNPWLNDFIAEWEKDKKQLEKEGKRIADFEVYEPYAADVSEGKNNPIYNAHSYHTKVPHPAIMRYILHYTQPGDIVLDGYAGTGMTGVASNKCANPEEDLKLVIENEFKNQGYLAPKWGKRNSICGDLSVIASFIANVYSSKFDFENFIRTTENIFQEFENEYGWMYKTNHTNGRAGEIEFVVWNEILQCSFCAHEYGFTDLFYDSKSKRINKEANCPNCSSVITKNSSDLVFETYFDDAIKMTLQRPKRKIHKIHYKYSGDRFSKDPDEFDVEIINKIEGLPFPKNAPCFELPDIQMKKVGRVTTTKITHIHHFYLRRAILSIEYFWNKSHLFKDENNQKLYHFMVEQMIWGMSLLNRFRPTGFSQVNQYMSGVFYIASHSSEINPMYLLVG